MTKQLELFRGRSIDEAVDAEIAQCLSITNPRSFFLFAGAGSGKTRSLINALQHVRDNLQETLEFKGQRVGVITYTNAACEEIKSRLRHDPLIDVKTIHSFAWSLIDGFDNDIREWLRLAIPEKLRVLDAAQAKAKGRASKESEKRLRKLASGRTRLERLDDVARFVYSPVGDNLGRDALNHAEVLQLTSHFLSKTAMQSILVGRYPILLVDESQDTNKGLVEALFAVQAARKSSFSLGLFGDMMQRIYMDGKDGLDQNLPNDWVMPAKLLNHRCPRRVVALINRVRSTVDSHTQQARVDAIEGTVRLFVLPSGIQDKQAAERSIADTMARVTGDRDWDDLQQVKLLTLEHRMAAARMGFSAMFDPLYQVESWRNSLLEGRLPIARFFTQQVLEILRAAKSGDRFRLAALMKAQSPRLSREALEATSDTRKCLQEVNTAVQELVALWDGAQEPILREVLRAIAKSRLLSVPEALEVHASQEVSYEPIGSDAKSPRDLERTKAVHEFLEAPFSQVERFADYFAGRAAFDTHQGVKGREFDRVMVIMDDEEARGFLFKYENLFGGKPSDDRSVEATRRLFYVTCSRAKKSLALVAYAKDVSRVRAFMLHHSWFSADEIVTQL